MIETKSKIEQLQKELEKVNEELAGLQEELGVIEGQILEVGGADYKKKKEEVEVLAQELSQAER